MKQLIGPKCFLSSSFFILTILSTYGIVGLILNYRQATKIRDFGEWPFNIRPLFFTFMIIQALFPVAGLFALLAGCKKQAMFLYCSGFVLLAIFTCSCAFATATVRENLEEINNGFYTAFTKTINDTGLIEWMSDLQWQHKCCGVYSYMDWSQVKAKSSDKLHFDGSSVPLSCCRRENVVPHEECGKGLLTGQQSSHHADELIYTTGCGAQVSELIQNTTFRLGVEMWIAGLVSLSVAIFLIYGVTKFYVATGNSLTFNTTNGPSSPGLNSNSGLVPNGQTRDLEVNDPNNNNRSGEGEKSRAFGERDKMRNAQLRKMRIQKALTSKTAKQRLSRITLNRQILSLAPVLSHSKFLGSRSSSSNTRGQICASKSFILGEAQSYLLNAVDGLKNESKDQDLLRKNVDMLWYQSIDKNMSTMSTTPNITSSTNVSTLLQNKRPMGFDLTAMMNDAFSQRNTLYTLVSERPFTPSLSQNCSVPLVTLPNGDIGALGQCNPHFPNCNKQQGHPLATSLQAEAGEEEETEQCETACDQLSSPANAPLVQNGNSTVITDSAQEPPAQDDTEKTLSTGASSPPLTMTSSKYPTSSVRSSTLATIQEESESVKGSPVNTKSTSPAGGYMTPENVSPTQTSVFQDGSSSEASVSDSTHVEIQSTSQCHNDNNNFSNTETLSELRDIQVNSLRGKLDDVNEESIVHAETDIPEVGQGIVEVDSDRDNRNEIDTRKETESIPSGPESSENLLQEPRNSI